MNRTDLLNYLIHRYDLKSYLELGTQNKGQNFHLIDCELKACVDINPQSEPTWVMSTDEFFLKFFKLVEYDLIFIDASHEAEQVERDYYNAVRILAPGGFIVLHDCNPLLEEYAIVPRPKPSGHWNGNCYIFASQLIDIVTVDIDNGCGVVRQGKTGVDPETKPNNWAEFDKHRATFLNLTSWDDFLKLKL